MYMYILQYELPGVPVLRTLDLFAVQTAIFVV